jgi:hypothetical protein
MSKTKRRPEARMKQEPGTKLIRYSGLVTPSSFGSSHSSFLLRAASCPSWIVSPWGRKNS